jgi:uncharacterized protein YaeQ
MAQGATVYNFTVRLADADRGVYETLNLRLARHPSETAEFLLTRLLAYCLEYTEGIAWSKGLSDPDEPAIAVRDIGAPEAARLHKAAKAARRVAVYAHRELESWLARLAGERIHKAEAVEVYEVDRQFLAAFVARLERRMDFDLSVADRTLYLGIGDATLTGSLARHSLES